MASTETKPTTDVTSRRPVDIFGAMRGEMDRMLGRFEHGWPNWPAAFGRTHDQGLMIPEFDVHENGKQFTIEVDLPGVDEKDVAVTLSNGMLTVKGEKKSEREESEENYYMAERSYGAFERSLRLPETVDDSKLEARYSKGVLTIIAQKKPDAIKAAKTIEIKKGDM